MRGWAVMTAPGVRQRQAARRRILIKLVLDLPEIKVQA
jgi:hypothetical protein